MPQPKYRKIAVLGYRSVGKCLIQFCWVGSIWWYV